MWHVEIILLYFPIIKLLQVDWTFDFFFSLENGTKTVEPYNLEILETHSCPRFELFQSSNSEFQIKAEQNYLG